MRMLSYVHRGGPTPLIGATVDAFVRQVAEQCADSDAVVSLHQADRLTYRELDARVEPLARGLLALGVQRGDRVGVWSTDNVEWILVQLATARIGAVLVNVNPAYRAAELLQALRAARVQVLFLIPSFRTSRYVDMLREVCPEVARRAPEELACSALPELRHVVLYDPQSPATTARAERGLLTWGDVLERGAAVRGERVEERAASLDPDDPINIQFTSGTTGVPKAVVLTHHNILNNAYFVGEVLGFGPEDRLCVPVPLYHCFGMVVSTLGCLARGSALVIPAPHFDAGATLAAIARERCTAVHGVPTMFVAQLEHPSLGELDLASLRTGIMAGAPCPPELVRRVIEEMGCEGILIGYGQTEASPVTHLTRPDDAFERRVGTVGTNLPHQEVKVVDAESGALLQVGEQGEVCFRGYHVMRGYFGREDATREAIDEAGWLRSGDLGVLEEDGYLRITGRIKDLIIRGGENIDPAEIEAFYCGHPEVAEVAVVGVPDEELGEEVGAWVRLRPGGRLEPEELRAWGRGRMAHYKVPRYVWVIDELPMTVTGKVQKFRLREMAGERVR